MMKRIPNLSILFLGSLLLCLWLASCGGAGQGDKGSTAAKERERTLERQALKVGVLPTLDCLPVLLLKDSVLYDSAKADIRLKCFTSQMDIDTALVGGSVQVGVSDMVRAAYLGRRGTHLRSLTSTGAAWSLYVPKGSKVDSLAKLSDKTVGMTRHSVTDLLTEEVRGKAHLKWPLYTAQINDATLRLRMLLNDELEAAWLTEPQATQARLAGAKALVDHSKDSVRLGVIVYHENPSDDYAQRTLQIDEFQNAYNRACKAINAHGLFYYAPLLRKYMGLNDAAIKRLPPVHYDGIKTPRAVDVQRAKKFR